MELVNINEIFMIVLAIYLFIGIIIILRPTFRKINLIRLINKSDFEKFLKTADMYIQKSKSKRIKNMFRLEKIKAMMTLRKFTGIENEVNSIELDFSDYSIIMICNTILNLYILGSIEEGRILVSKIQNQIKQQDEKIRQNFGIRLCVAINDYFSNDFVKSKKELQELLNEGINLKKINNYQKNCIANIYFYLGLISKLENEMIKSKNYLDNAIAIFYPQQCAIVRKASKIIDEIPKE